MIDPLQRCTPAHNRCSRYHTELVNGYREERERQETQLEDATGLAPGDVAIYLQTTDLITFKAWLIGSAHREDTRA